MDGIEDEKEGLDLYEMAELVLNMGISQAVVNKTHNTISHPKYISNEDTSLKYVS